MRGGQAPAHALLRCAHCRPLPLPHPIPNPRSPPAQCFPGEGPQLLAPALQALLRALLSGRESGLVTAAALGVYARVLLHNGAAFLGLFQAAAAAGAAPPEDAAAAPPQGAGGAEDPAARLLLWLVDLWLDKFDSIGQVQWGALVCGGWGWRGRGGVCKASVRGAGAGE